MTEGLQPTGRSADERTYLLDHPQRLGILPSYRFWNDRDNWRLVRVPQAMLAAALIVVVGFAKFPVYLAVTIPAVILILTLGVFERYIRRQARVRRREIAAGDALGSNPHADHRPDVPRAEE